ncbi:mechanosensitive ion channel domain-containing protein [Nocardioides marinus]|uniref:Small-conductance mechanosensitive channel n=1 Tax=Nocardioides marinus TaxID=374514 RepID=A0A7Y9YFN7_9ACTN|nr:small-conductance mechanosensitive channel [Nocardioides marinus]
MPRPLAADSTVLPPVTWEGVALGLAVLVVGYLVGRALGWAVGHVLLWRGRSPSASAMFATLTRWVVLVVAFAATVTVIFPSVQPVNALGGIGVLSIAAGIAFQTVLGNMFAGIVILARDTFRVDDQVAIRDVAGTVTAVSLTSTSVRTFDGRLVHVPNAVVHSEVVTVQTGYEQVRSTVAVDIDDAADLDLAVRVAERSMLTVPGVLADPPPQALLQEVGTATVRMDLRFWSGARQMETRIAQHEVIRAVLRGLSDAGVKTGSDVVTVTATPELLAALGQRERGEQSERS